VPTVETGPCNFTRHEDGPPTGFPHIDLGRRPVPVTYHGSGQQWHGPAWANTQAGLCEGCDAMYGFQHKTPLPGMACIAVMQPGGAWVPIHRVRPVSYTRA
jgi:hypothetical protein